MQSIKEAIEQTESEEFSTAAIAVVVVVKKMENARHAADALCMEGFGRIFPMRG